MREPVIWARIFACWGLGRRLRWRFAWSDPSTTSSRRWRRGEPEPPTCRWTRPGPRSAELSWPRMRRCRCWSRDRSRRRGARFVVDLDADADRIACAGLTIYAHPSGGNPARESRLYHLHFRFHRPAQGRGDYPRQPAEPGVLAPAHLWRHFGRPSQPPCRRGLRRRGVGAVAVSDLRRRDRACG